MDFFLKSIIQLLISISMSLGAWQNTLRCTIAAILLTLVFEHGHAQTAISSLYLIGDAGKTSVVDNGLQESLHDNFDKETPSAFVFLGDNVYPKGMPPGGRGDRLEAEKVIRAQIDMVKEFHSPVYFIPGNHDWNKGSRDGLDYVRREQHFVDSLDIPLVTFLPKDGCPGPSEIQLTGFVLIIIDSQWFLQAKNSGGDHHSCDCKTTDEVIEGLENLIRKNSGKRIVLAAHHPIYTYGSHGGVFNWRAHVFPLTDINPSLYFPLPVVGSLYPLYRKWIGDVQDTANPVNRRYRNSIESLLKRHPEILFVSGHEHALEHIVKDGVNYVVSGSSVNSSTVKKKKHASFVSSKNGFARIDSYSDGSLAISYYEVRRHEVAFTVHLPSTVK